jgi:hypothetical protein
MTIGNEGSARAEKCQMSSQSRHVDPPTEARRGHGATQVANARLHIALTAYYHSTIKKKILKIKLMN